MSRYEFTHNEMNDLKPFEHGQEGTHGACQEMLDKHGGKTKCCACTGHECKSVDAKKEHSIKKQNVLIEKLKKAVKTRDNEEVHGLYDELIIMRLRQHEPSFIRRLDRIVAGVNFWYS